MKNFFSILLVLSCISNTYAQIGIKANNSAPIPSAQLEVQSTTKAFYPPRMTTAQRTTMPSPPLAGAVVFDMDLNGLFTYNGSSWVSQVGLTLPYSISQSGSGSSLLNINNIGSADEDIAIFASSKSKIYGTAIIGIATNENPTGDNTAIRGFNASVNAFGSGVYGEHDGAGIGTSGSSVSGIGIKGSSNSGIAGSFSSSNGYALITNSGNVGIGIPAPLERLHVSGNIRASSLAGTGVRNVKANVNGTLIATPQIYNLSIAPQSFQPRFNNSGTFTSSGSYSNCFMSAGSTDYLVAPVSLPDGADITSVTLYYIDTDVTAKINCSLFANPYSSTGITNYFGGITTATSSAVNSILAYNIPENTGSNALINNVANSYFLFIYPSTSSGVFTPWVNNISVKGVKITYTL
jgi:hypothetical protein